MQNMHETGHTTFKWLHEDDGSNAGFKDKQFFKSFLMNGVHFKIDDIVVAKTSEGQLRLCKLLVLYEGYDRLANVRWYKSLNKLPKSVLGRIKSLTSNEVVLDYDDKDVVVPLSCIVKKCAIVYPTCSPSAAQSLSKDIKLFYSCRYKLKNGRLVELNTAVIINELTIFDNANQTPDIKIDMQTRRASQLKNSPAVVASVSVGRAKRNLNSSFGNSPQAQSPSLDYSIVETTSPMKLKLKVSQRYETKVLLERLEVQTTRDGLKIKKRESEGDAGASPSPPKRSRREETKENKEADRLPSLRAKSPKVALEKIDLNVEDDTKRRRSTRTVSRKSYTDYVSPLKPARRSRIKSSDSELDSKTSVVLAKRTRRARTLSTNSTIECTPTKTVKFKQRVSIVNEENEEANEFRTPVKRAKNLEGILKTPNRTPNRTPGRTIRFNGAAVTPSMHERNSSIEQCNTPLSKAKSSLHVSHVPQALPCRENEYEDIFNFVAGKLSDGCGGCIYISGVPGTGKTATVTAVVRQLQGMAEKGDMADFDFISINGMKLSEPRQCYVEVYKQLMGKTLPWEQAQSMLEARFTKSKKKNLPVVLLVDEFDILCTKRQDVVYNLLDWPTKSTAHLLVITIANTMDLPERLLMGRVTSRLGLTRLTFQAYTFKQLQEIVTKRLTGINAFNPDAIQLVARKVASVSGDARRALDICRRAAEIAEAEGDDTVASIQHVNAALNNMITQPKVRAIKHCSRLEQLLLQAVVAEVERTGVDETMFADVYTMLGSVCGIDGFKTVSSPLALAAVTRLNACRLLLIDQKTFGLQQKIILNVSSDDIYYALRQD